MSSALAQRAFAGAFTARIQAPMTHKITVAPRASSSPLLARSRVAKCRSCSSRSPSGLGRTAATRAVTAASADFRSKAPADIRVLVVGATGYIGKFVVRELVKRGYDVVAMAREKSGIGGKAGKEDTMKEFPGAEVVFGDVTDMESLKKAGFAKPVDVVVSCLASRTGGIKDSNLIDYQATANAMNAGRQSGAQHFVLLSAICVQKPLLEFQKAKLELEAELVRAAAARENPVSYSIVRPTAFFKSLAGQFVKLFFYFVFNF